ncbi:GNAT family N-acetyltransferase [Pantoea trifolii]|uniref:GNAT family N-acetyltransferase n=1 Tax=Pantoea trifolii TaxID=2968030 RepID=A0ABT1VRC1_9GAMM|nr:MULTISPECIES: GNAT family protein [unclassified Pantoea]MCQ8230091.1 GNAT family N-acetyltransferase [Pantoea sp. MMK2]MCQ8238806.1 GNAT family N-acetyltransferase [Pantoea sp. MMK3]
MTTKLHLETLRLTCSQITEDDRDFFRQLQLSPQVMHYIADAKSEEKIHADFTARLPLWSPRSAHWLCLVVREKQSGNCIGVNGYIHRDSDCAEVGFLFAPEAQGKGYAHESLRAICDYAFGEGGIRRLSATVTAGNTPSRRLLEKVGFVLEGELRESYWLRNAWHNDWLFGLLRGEYRL